MGTSKGYGGPSSGLVPSFVNDPPAPALAPRPVAPLAQPAAPLTQTAPRQHFGTSGGDLRTARSNFTRFSRTGSRNSLATAVSGYVRTGNGGAKRAAQRMGSSRAVAGELLGMLRDVQRAGPVDALRRLKLDALAGRPAPDVLVTVLEFICPPGGAVDEAIARAAMLEAIGDMAEAGLGSFDALTPEQMREFFLDFVARSIEGRVVADIGARGIKIPDDVSAVESAQAQLHDFITGATRGQLSSQLNDVAEISNLDIEGRVNQIYEAAFELIAAAGEAVG